MHVAWFSCGPALHLVEPNILPYPFSYEVYICPRYRLILPSVWFLSNQVNHQEKLPTTGASHPTRRTTFLLYLLHGLGHETMLFHYVALGLLAAAPALASPIQATPAKRAGDDAVGLKACYINKEGVQICITPTPDVKAKREGEE